MLLVINIMAFVLISISFLSGRSFGEEGTIVISDIEAFLRHSLYGIIISVVFSALALILGYLFKTLVNITKSTLRRMFIGEFILFLSFFLVLYSYIYLIA